MSVHFLDSHASGYARVSRQRLMTLNEALVVPSGVQHS